MVIEVDLGFRERKCTAGCPTNNNRVDAQLAHLFLGKPGIVADEFHSSSLLSGLLIPTTFVVAFPKLLSVI